MTRAPADPHEPAKRRRSPRGAAANGGAGSDKVIPAESLVLGAGPFTPPPLNGHGGANGNGNGNGHPDPEVVALAVAAAQTDPVVAVSTLPAVGEAAAPWARSRRARRRERRRGTAEAPALSRRARRRQRREAVWAANRAAGEAAAAEAQAAAPKTTKPVSKAKAVKQARAQVAPAWGWREQGRGRAVHVAAGPEYQATTTQACGLFPFLAGSGSPSMGVPVGRHLLWGEVVCLDQFAWLASGLVTNPGVFVLGQPGTGKSSLIKRLMRGMAGFGVRPFVLGDLKPDYTQVVERLGGQVIRIGRGLDKINPLDTGPLGQAAARMSGPAAERLRAESRGRRLNALLALLTLVRRYPLNNGEENVLAAVIDLLDEKGRKRRSVFKEPTVPDVLTILRGDAGLDMLMAAADVESVEEFRRDTKELRQTLNLLCSGSLKGVFDGPTTRPIDLDAPAVSVDISQVSAAGDTLVAAAMLSTWAYGFAMIDGASALADEGLAPRRQFLAVRDELWRALRGSPGLVEHADALTRVNRAKGVADITATHSLADLEALATEEDRAKARGFIERAGVVILAGLPPRELYQVAEVVSLSAEERAMVAGWSAPASWVATEKHPGRGKYLIKSGQRVGIPVELEYVGDEAQLYDTDSRMMIAAAEAAGIESQVVVGA